MRRVSLLFCGIAVVAFAGVALATDYDEGISGDISTSRLAPTSAALTLGNNRVTATSIGGAVPDREYFHWALPPGLQLSQIILEAYSTPVGGDEIAFIAVQAGTTFTEPPTGTNVANLLGYTHFGAGAGPGLAVGDDVLDDLGNSDGGGAQGFTPPLTGPDYTFWMQQTNPNFSATYTFNFVVVPEPGTLCLLGTGAVGLLLARRARRE